MPLWSRRPGYANLNPAQPLTPIPASQTAAAGSSADDKPMNRPRSSTLDRVRERKVALDQSEDHESLLGHDDPKIQSRGSPLKKRESFKPTLPSVPSSKRLSFSLDVIHFRKGTARIQPAATVSKTESMAQPSEENKHVSSKATKQAETVLCMIAGPPTLVEKPNSAPGKAISAKNVKDLKCTGVSFV